jgi:DNA-binding MarR family transcriptional regulator
MSAENTRRAGPECFGFTARLLSRVITGVYDDALATVGLKVSQFSVLTAIANREDTRPAELAKFLAMDESPGDDDRRSHQISVTEKGMALLRKSYSAWEKAQNQVAQRLGPEGVTALKSIVKKLRS